VHVLRLGSPERQAGDSAARLEDRNVDLRWGKGPVPGGDLALFLLLNAHDTGELLVGGRSVIVYGTVMVTRLVGNHTLHRIEATSPGGGHMEFEVTARKRHRGSVRVIWDPDGIAEPRFAPEVPWQTIGIAALVIIAIVAVGWLVFA